MGHGFREAGLAGLGIFVFPVRQPSPSCGRPGDLSQRGFWEHKENRSL